MERILQFLWALLFQRDKNSLLPWWGAWLQVLPWSSESSHTHRQKGTLENVLGVGGGF